jgi:6-phosphogluconolactonase
MKLEVLPTKSYAQAAAALVAAALPEHGTVVLTGGTSAARLYPELAATRPDWAGIEVFFSDERCVPPDHEASNFHLVRSALLEAVGPATVHRMRGEDDPTAAAASYDRLVATAGRFDLVLLSLGADCHVAALFPWSPALAEQERLCVAVERPDGLGGLTLTPPALRATRRAMILAQGRVKAAALRRALGADGELESCPARLLARIEDLTYIADAEAARGL